MFQMEASAFQRTAGGTKSSIPLYYPNMRSQLVARPGPKSGKKWLQDGLFPSSMTSLKKIMEGPLSAFPVLWMAPRLSWEAGKAGLRSHALPDMQCKETSPFPEESFHFCVSGLIHSGTISAQLEQSVGCSSCSALAFIPGIEDWQAFWLPAGHVKVDGMLATQSFADLLLWLVSPAAGQPCI